MNTHSPYFPSFNPYFLVSSNQLWPGPLFFCLQSPWRQGCSQKDEGGWCVCVCVSIWCPARWLPYFSKACAYAFVICLSVHATDTTDKSIKSWFLTHNFLVCVLRRWGLLCYGKTLAKNERDNNVAVPFSLFYCLLEKWPGALMKVICGLHPLEDFLCWAVVHKCPFFLFFQKLTECEHADFLKWVSFRLEAFWKKWSCRVRRSPMQKFTGGLIW